MNEVEPKSSSELLEDKSYTDPYEYYQSFLESRSFKEAFENRRKDLETDGIDASDEKVMKGFFMTNKYKDLLWDYYEGGAIIKYEPGEYNDKVNEALRRYWDFIKNSREAFENVPKQAVIGDKIIRITSKEMEDDSRMSLHYRSAKEMSKYLHEQGKPINIGICRLLIHMMGVSQGLDRVDRNRDEKRTRSVFGQQ